MTRTSRTRAKPGPSPRPSAPVFSAARFAPLIPGALAAILYAPAAWNGFALDDRTDLLENRFVTGRLDLRGIFTSDYYGGWGYLASGHYRPLLVLTYKLASMPFGLTPVPYHVLNVVVFAL